MTDSDDDDTGWNVNKIPDGEMWENNIDQNSKQYMNISISFWVEITKYICDMSLQNRYLIVSQLANFIVR